MQDWVMPDALLLVLGLPQALCDSASVGRFLRVQLNECSPGRSCNWQFFEVLSSLRVLLLVGALADIQLFCSSWTLMIVCRLCLVANFRALVLF